MYDEGKRCAPWPRDSHAITRSQPGHASRGPRPDAPVPDRARVLVLWGWYNEWQLSPAHGEDQLTTKPASTEPAVDVVAASPRPGAGSNGPSAADPVRIEFPSADAVSKVGIKAVPAQVQAMNQVVTAPGMVDYDPGRYARLTSRAAGIVWRVYKNIGEPIHKGEVLALIDAAEVGQLKSDFLQDMAQVTYRKATLQRLEGLSEQGAASEAAVRAAKPPCARRASASSRTSRPSPISACRSTSTRWKNSPRISWPGGCGSWDFPRPLSGTLTWRP